MALEYNLFRDVKASACLGKIQVKCKSNLTATIISHPGKTFGPLALLESLFKKLLLH